MATQSSTAVRLVRCPGCREVLAELPEVSLYRCGGCGTVLQAKNRKRETTAGESPAQEAYSTARTQQDSAATSNDGSTRPPSVESSPDQCSIGCNDDGIKEDISVEVPESSKQDGSSIVDNSGGHVSKSGDESIESSRFGSNEVPSSGELTHSPAEHDDEIQNLPELEDEEEIESPQNNDSELVVMEDDKPNVERDAKNANRNSDNAVVLSQRSLNESLDSYYLTCPDDEEPPDRNYGRISSIDTAGSSSVADRSSDPKFKYESAANDSPLNGYYAYDGSESSYDGTDDQIRRHVPSRVRPASREPERNYCATNSLHRAMQGGISGCRRSSLPPRPGFNSSEKNSYSEAEKMNLLRRVHELKDQLNRIHFPKVHRRFPAGAIEEKFSPLPYEYLWETYSGLNHHLRHDHRQGCGDRCSVSRPAFSGEAVHYRHRHGCSCLHCHPQDWLYSAQLPCRNRCCDRNVVASLSSPQHYTSSELSLWGGETANSGIHRSNEIKRLRFKEKYNVAKKHLLPVAGGAPFVACYRCFELLQVPDDFLLFERKCRQMKCNACRKILKFSLVKGTRLVPYVPKNVSAPPPSVVDNYIDNAAESRNLEQMSHSSSYQQVEASSYSDNERSQGRSCSTEGEVSVVSSTGKQVRRSPYNGRMSSTSSSITPVDNRKMKSVATEDRSVAVGTKAVEIVGPSRTSEIEEVLPMSNSPLHQLMGYSSPSHVMNK
ncbi:protein ENHANCED DISEASE RESISTANCE 4-like [Andrographis paniculata]|uniref:protein ENHANCED DISEASE RESISTANCE 4-like n=1 Tax=Andrographis paniculata TaxID=175694 RepID=UPI0021E814F3|nr:protein ENHANCED DISEASE RESISTANCE 4-like [Andrographis paniculata]